MSLPEVCANAFESLQRAHAAGRLSHSYLVVGHPRGYALDVAEALLQLLMCAGPHPPCGVCPACRQVKAHIHPDTHWVEPAGKAREIKVEPMRALTHFVSETSFLGGWKGIVVQYADRMNENAANAFLKALEEPPPRCVLLLLTDSPQALLATIVSRCQRISVTTEFLARGQPWEEELLEVLAQEGATDDVVGLYTASSRFAGILSRLRKEIEAETPVEEDAKASEKEVREARIRARVLETRAEIVRFVLFWRRDVLLAAQGGAVEALHFSDRAAAIRQQALKIGAAGALGNMKRLDDMLRRLDRHFRDDVAWSSAFADALGAR